MMESLSSPDPSTISSQAFAHLLSLYPSVLEAVYKTKAKDPKKLASALEDDKWRYEGLPGKLKAGTEQVKGINKDELQRLIQWKITHGTYRPFLPSLIRKNDPQSVKDIVHEAFTSQSAETYSAIPQNGLPDGLSKAIKIVSKLQGVGPATAPLLCSIYDPANVPFFEDELYAWLCPGNKKLKYNLKEYVELFGEARKLQKRMGMTAADVEKVGYVVGHMDVLDADQKAELETVMKRKDLSSDSESQQEQKAEKKEESKGEMLVQRLRKSSPYQTATKIETTVGKGTKKRAPPKELKSERQSKRTKK